MKKLLILFLLASPCQAEIISKLSSSTSLTVGASSTQATRVPSTYAVSGTNIKVSTGEHIGKLTAGSATAAATLDVGTYEINTACLLYTSPSPRDVEESRMPSSA